MTYSVYAMDTFFYSYLGVYPVQTRCEMLKELGYDGAYITLLGEAEERSLDETIKAIQKVELDLAGVYAFLDIKGDTDTTEDVCALVNRLPAGSTLELACREINEDNPDHEARDINEESLGTGLYTQTLIPALHKIAEKAATNNITVALYPHAGFHLSHIRQAYYLCQQVNHPNLKLMYTGFHDFAVCKSGADVRLREAVDFLHQVNISGVGLGGPLYGYTISQLEAGVMDNFAILAILKNIGYTGKIGFQGYAMGGDVYQHLLTNLKTFRAWEARLEAHPNWGLLEYGQRYWLP